jgi:hypothetical protein
MYFWVVTPCRLVCVSVKHAVSIIRAEALFVKRWYLHTSPHGVTTQNIIIDVLPAVRTLNLTCNYYSVFAYAYILVLEHKYIYIYIYI